MSMRFRVSAHNNLEVNLSLDLILAQEIEPKLGRGLITKLANWKHQTFLLATPS